MTKQDVIFFGLLCSLAYLLTTWIFWRNVSFSQPWKAVFSLSAPPIIGITVVTCHFLDKEYVIPWLWRIFTHKELSAHSFISGDVITFPTTMLAIIAWHLLFRTLDNRSKTQNNITLNEEESIKKILFPTHHRNEHQQQLTTKRSRIRGVFLTLIGAWLVFEYIVSPLQKVEEYVNEITISMKMTVFGIISLLVGLIWLIFGDHFGYMPSSKEAKTPATILGIIAVGIGYGIYSVLKVYLEAKGYQIK